MYKQNGGISLLYFIVIIVIFFAVVAGIVGLLFRLVKVDTFSYDEKYLWNDIEGKDYRKYE